MKIPFEPVDHLLDRDPQEPSGRPASVLWWHLATPEPDYALVVIRVTAFSADGNTISCHLIGPDSGAEVDSAEDVDLTNWTNVWPGPPSTYDHTKIVIGTNDPRDHVIMCFSTKWLEDNANNVFQELKRPGAAIKWPWGEDMLRIALTAAKDLDQALREAHRKIAAIEGPLKELGECKRPEEIDSYRKLRQLLGSAG